MKKDRQHHVWRAYLGAWAANNKIVVLQANRIFTTNVSNVAVQHQYYKLEQLSANEIAFIRKAFVDVGPPMLQEIHRNTLTMTTALPAIRDSVTEQEIAKYPKLVRELDEAVINTGEDYHSALESHAAPLINAARNGDIGFYSDDEKAVLLSYFIALQYFRTAAMRKRVIDGFEGKSPIDLERCWNVISFILAENLGFSLFIERKRRPLILLENDSTVPFITGDQPAVNLMAVERGTVPEFLALYYPVSPRFALVLDDPGKSVGLARPVTVDAVRLLNAAMVREAERQVFANSEAVLAQYLPTAAPLPATDGGHNGDTGP